MKFWWCLLSLTFLAAEAYAQLAVDLTAEGTWSEVVSSRERIGASLKSPLFDLGAALGINSDGKYGPDIANWRGKQSFFNNYLLLEEGFLLTRWDRVVVQAGRFPMVDAFDSPYSLFLSSRNPALMGAFYRYEDRHFTFENRWMELNRSSDFVNPADVPPAWAGAGLAGFPDRGASLKTLTFRWGTQRFGIQDASVYTGRTFDAEYFLSPMPAYFTQYVKGTAGRPWMTGANENNLIGFFWDWKESGFTLGAQLLVDDFSLNFILPEQVPNNPWKLAWTLGGTLKTDWGTWGFHQAASTKYTFAPYSAVAGQEGKTSYGYTLYPDVEYKVGEAWRGLEVEDNSLGYLHGENNLALMLTYQSQPLPPLRISARAEFTLAGAKSPANPWHDGTLAREYGTHWLDDAVLEKRVLGTFSASWAVGEGVFVASVRLGWVWNRLELRLPRATSDPLESHVDQYIKIYEPSSGSGPLGGMTFGGTYPLDLSRLLWGDDAE